MADALEKTRVLAALDPGQRAIVNAARRVSQKRGEPLYLVGGPVRDLLLGRSVGDVDLTVEGDGPSFARALAGLCGAEIVVHARFRTATLTLPGGSRVDVAAARSETYERPGALPSVRPAGIREDLARRDFTINALALRLTPGFQPQVLDPEGGRADLRDGKIRFLHEGSALDDPTRAFRAARYANRFGFTIAAGTRRAIRKSLESGAFGAVSADRLRREIEKLFAEPDRAGAVSRLTALGLHAALHPALSSSPETLRRLRRAEKAAVGSNAGWLVYLLVWSAGLDTAQASQLAGRLNLPRRDADRLNTWPATIAALRGLSVRDTAGRAALPRLGLEETIAASA
ncbi:MAG: CCA tRNA nucleotidyltransferase, partial [Thermoanaerobaculia bacterium]|nr:CCA tRNA nucleotidyltransferase [Thermoanaerobaculia bacterium]